MEDRVGDVLAQRAALHAGAGLGIALSLLLHGGLSALAIWAALHTAEAQTPRAIQIRLAPVARASEPVAPAVSKPAQPAAKMETPAPPIVPTKPPIAPPKPEKNTVPLSPFGKSAKKGSETAAPSVAVPPSAPAIAVPVGGAGVIGLEGGDFPYTIYIERMKTLIGSHWFRPQVGAGPTTTVHFVIERDGTIREAKVETESGNGTFDRAALRAVLESSPLPPLPFGYTGNYLGVHLNFR
ncbi:MAG TPA: TonB family protein [Thermoanaerobaculia bacterium]|nr:TonB family protein [Thermoanaerobaculia bacterium]